MYINENKYLEDELIIVSKLGEFKIKFDKEDVDLIKKFHWRVSNKKNKYYVCTGQAKNGGKILYMHNIVMKFEPNKTQEVDHIDSDPTNNRKSNLRIVERIINIQNVYVRDDNKTTGIRGVSYDSRYDKYTVDFRFNKKRYYFKPFKSLSSAVYLRYLCETHFLGEYRCFSNDELLFSHINKLSEESKLSIYEYFKNKI